MIHTAKEDAKEYARRKASRINASSSSSVQPTNTTLGGSTVRTGNGNTRGFFPIEKGVINRGSSMDGKCGTEYRTKESKVGKGAPNTIHTHGRETTGTFPVHSVETKMDDGVETVTKQLRGTSLSTTRYHLQQWLSAQDGKFSADQTSKLRSSTPKGSRPSRSRHREVELSFSREWTADGYDHTHIFKVRNEHDTLPEDKWVKTAMYRGTVDVASYLNNRSVSKDQDASQKLATNAEAQLRSYWQTEILGIPRTTFSQVPNDSGARRQSGPILDKREFIDENEEIDCYHGRDGEKLTRASLWL